MKTIRVLRGSQSEKKQKRKKGEDLFYETYPEICRKAQRQARLRGGGGRSVMSKIGRTWRNPPCDRITESLICVSCLSFYSQVFHWILLRFQRHLFVKVRVTRFNSLSFLSLERLIKGMRTSINLDPHSE